MKKLLLTLILLFTLHLSKSQNEYYISDFNGQTINTCRGLFLPSWLCFVPGAGITYCNNENYTLTLCSGVTGKPLQVSFLPLCNYIGAYPCNTLFLEENYDFLTVFDGPNTSSTVLANLTGILNDPFHFVSSGECLTFRFTSDISIVGFGWYAIIGCEPDSCNNNPPAADICANAPQICNLDGYCGNTSGWYTPDNRELSSLYGGSFCGTIENNSWIKFVAGATSASFQLTSSNCVSTSSGIQAIIYQSSNCSTFTPVSNCVTQFSGQGTFTLTTNVPLTIGQTYYIMIDGYAGNTCDYVVTASSGIQTYTVSGPPGNVVCRGFSTTLTVNGAPAGATYQWSPASAIIGPTNGQSVTVNPDITTEFTVIVNSTICDIDTLTYTLNVEKPTASANNSGPFCEGGNINLSASGGSTYAWAGPGGFTSSSQNPGRPNATTAMSGTYQVIVTDAYGCKDTTTTNVVVNPQPTITINPAGPIEICPPATTSLDFNSAGLSNIQWYIGAAPIGGANSNSITVSGAGSYYVTAMDTNGCTGTSNQVTVSLASTITPAFAAIPPICNGDPTPTLPATSNNGITGTWSPLPVSNSASGTYTFTPDAGQCATTTTLDVTVNQPVTPTFDPISDLCAGDPAPLLPGTSSEGISGTWNPSTVNTSVTTTYNFTPTAGQCATGASMTITVNDIPTITPIYHD